MDKTISGQIKLGWINYLNLFPLHCEIKEKFSSSFYFSYGPPAQINNLLRLKKVDLAPSSSICLIKDEPLYSLPIGVCANGPVQSVYLGLRKEHKAFYNEFLSCKKKFKEMTKVLTQEKKEATLLARDLFALENNSKIKDPPLLNLTTESETSIELGKILLSLVLGKPCLNLMLSKRRKSTQEKFDLIIGDHALKQRHTYEQIIDLSELWYEITGLPFVFAVWQGHSRIQPSLQNELLVVCKEVEAKMHQEPEFYLKKMPKKPDYITEGGLATYWKHLFYTIGDKEKQGLRVYLSLAKLRNSSVF